MKEQLIKNLISLILGMLDEETMKQFVDKILDVVENQIEKTPNKWDDMVIGGLCGKIREAFDIPDND